MGEVVYVLKAQQHLIVDLQEGEKNGIREVPTPPQHCCSDPKSPPSSGDKDNPHQLDTAGAGMKIHLLWDGKKPLGNHSSDFHGFQIHLLWDGTEPQGVTAVISMDSTLFGHCLGVVLSA